MIRTVGYATCKVACTEIATIFLGGLALRKRTRMTSILAIGNERVEITEKEKTLPIMNWIPKKQKKIQ